MTTPFTHGMAFQRAQQVMPGGVNSPVRSYRHVGGIPVFANESEGPFLISIEGRRYLDYITGWGALIHGHAAPAVVEAISRQAAKGFCFGVPSTLETTLIELIQQRMPTLEKVRLVNSGTEATMTAIRLARGVTGRTRLLKFEGHYHGHVDALLVQAGSGASAVPSSAGLPPATFETTHVLPFNDVAALDTFFERFGRQTAAVIFEPIAGNMNLIFPTPEFLSQLQTLCRAYGTLLIADEVMTGFRVHPQGAQALLQLTPDLTCLAKVIGGGLPLGALGGRKEYMDYLAPLGPVYQAGTLSGNAIAVAAGIASLNTLPDHYCEQLERLSSQLAHGLERLGQKTGVPIKAQAVGGLWGFTFLPREAPLRNYQDVQKADGLRFKSFFQSMLEGGVHLAPSPYEAGFVSLAHTKELIDKTLDVAAHALEKLSTIPCNSPTTTTTSAPHFAS